jgi:hypothetical protein
MSRNKVVVEEGVVRVVTVGIQGPPGVGISQAYADAGDAASRQRSNHTGTQPSSTISDFNTAADARIQVQKGLANGVATLGSDAKIPSNQLPALAITDTFPVASQAAMLALTAEVGDVAVRTDLNKSFILKTAGASTLGNWQELLTPTDSVLSVNGQTGAVSLTASGLGALAAANNFSDVANAATARTNLGLAIGTNVQAYSAELAGLAALSPSNDDVIQRKAGAWATRSMAQLKTDLALSKSDVGLGSVDNTSDLSKPVSTATQSALDLKAPLASPAFTGTPTAPTASAGTSSMQIATTAFVAEEIAGGATPDATTLVKGKVQLAGDLGGTAASPTVPGLATKQPLDATLTALAAYNSNGLLVQTAADTFTGRTIAAGSAKISITNGSGVSGDPTIDLGSVASTDLSNSSNITLLTGVQTVTGVKTFNAGAFLDKGNQVFNIEAYSAVGDGQQVFDGAMTNGSAILTSATAAFVPGDVGKYIIVTGAGSTRGTLLATTISAYTSATQVTLSGAATHTVSGASIVWGTENHTFIDDALTAAGSVGGVVFIPAHMYLRRINESFELPSGVELVGEDRERSILIGAGIDLAAGAVGNYIHNLTIDVNNNDDVTGINLYGRGHVVERVDIKNWGIFGVDFANGSSDDYMQFCYSDHNGGNQTGGGSFIIEGNYNNIHVVANMFEGDLTDNGSAFEFYLGEADDPNANTRAFVRDNIFQAQCAKPSYAVGTHIRISGNYFATDVEISSGYGIETDEGQITTADVEINGNRFVANANGGAETRLTLTPSSNLTDTGILQDIRIHHNQFEFGQITGDAEDVTTGNYIYGLQITNNTFRDAHTSNIFFELDGVGFTFDGLKIENNNFLNWREVGSSAWSAIAFASVSGAGTVTFSRSDISHNTFGPARAGVTNAIKFDAASGGAFAGTIDTFKNNFNGYSLVDLATPVLVQDAFATQVTSPIVGGSVSSAGTLTLKSTTHATKGKILFGTSGYDEANNRLGIGTASPSHKVEIVSPSASNVQALKITQNDASNLVEALFVQSNGSGAALAATATQASGAGGGYGAAGYFTSNSGATGATVQINRFGVSTTNNSNAAGGLVVASSAAETNVPLVKMSLSSASATQPVLTLTNAGTGPTLVTPDIKITTGAGSGKVLTSDGSGVATWQTPATGSVSTVSVVSANGFAGSVANATTTPAITLSTTVTGLLKGNGTAISAAVANTDYLPVASPTATGTLTAATLTTSAAVTHTVASGGNVVALTITQNDTTNNKKALVVNNSTTSNSIEVIPTGNTGTDVGSAGAIWLNNNSNTGIGLGVNTNKASASAALVSFRSETDTFDQMLTRLDYRGTSHGLYLIQRTTTNSNAAIYIQDNSTNANYGAIYVTAARTGQAVEFTNSSSGAALKLSSTSGLSLNAATGNVQLGDGVNIVVNTATGTKIATATNQKLGHYGVTPVVQPGATTDLGTVLSDLGLRAAGTAYPITTSGAVTLTGAVAMNATTLATDTTTGLKIATATSQRLGFYNSTPVVQPNTTGTTSGFTAGAGSAVDSAATFTGNTGSTAYTIGDIVRALKTLGLLAA